MNNFLTRLELQGFKSFADKTDFDLNDRIIGVVGPNGSGKSNIIDAIRWILGEREAKKLRGSLLENLIFAGTPKKSPSSLARVTLTFNNSSNFLPVDAKEVSISRRIDRSGNSQFYVNNKEIRLKDLISILAQARMGSRGLSIIGQGDADVFVAVNDSERREMIEEILGLKEYRLKKKTAELRLNKTKLNMEKLKFKLEETEPHLKFLKRQKNKWEKRTEIENELNKISKKYFSYNYYRLTDYIEGVLVEISKLEKIKNDKDLEILEINKILEEQNKPSKDENNKINEIRLKVKKKRSERFEIEKNIAKIEAKIEYEKKASLEKIVVKNNEEYSASYLLSLIKNFVDNSENVNNDELRIFVNNWVNKFKKLFSSNVSKEEKKENPGFLIDESVLKDLENAKKELENINLDIKKFENEEDRIISEQDDKNQEFRKQVEILENKKNEKREIENRINEKKMAEERANFRFKELKNKWISFGNSIDDLSNLERINVQGNENWNDLEIKIDRYKSKLAVIGEIDEALIYEANETEERYELMTSELEDVKRAVLDLEKLIDNLERKIHNNFKESFSLINKEFNNYFRLMFGGGKAMLKLSYPKPKVINNEGEDSENNETDIIEELTEEEKELQAGVEVSLNLPKKKIKSLDMLSGGEKTLVSMAALFALISVSPPPFLVLDEIDAALDDDNSRRFAELINDFAGKTQFIIVTHNKITMEIMDSLYGITMSDDGVSRVLSLRLEEAEEIAGN
jgi:chromosome segregation protein